MSTGSEAVAHLFERRPAYQPENSRQSDQGKFLMNTGSENITSQDSSANLLGIHAAIAGVLLGPFVAAFVSQYTAYYPTFSAVIAIYIIIGIITCILMLYRPDIFQKSVKHCADLSWNCWALAGVLILMKNYQDNSKFDWSNLFDVFGFNLTIVALSGIALAATLKASSAAFEILCLVQPIQNWRREKLQPSK